MKIKILFLATLLIPGRYAYSQFDMTGLDPDNNACRVSRGRSINAATPELNQSLSAFSRNRAAFLPDVNDVRQIADKDQKKDSTFYLNFFGTGSINKANNAVSYIFNNGLKFNIVSRSFTINTLNTWIYGQNQSVKTNNDYLSIADIDLFKSTRRIYYWALLSFEKSYSLNINRRFQSGGGIGVKLLTSPNAKLVVSDGPLYEASKLAKADVHGRTSYETVRNSLRIKFRFLIRDLFVVDGVDFLQNSLSDKNDYIIRSNTSLSVRINKWLSFTTTLSYNRLNLTDNENLLFTYGLSVEKFL